MLALFDHEVGSGSQPQRRVGLLGLGVRRIVLSRGGDREDFLRTMAAGITAPPATWRRLTELRRAHRPGHQIALSAVVRCSR